MRFITDKSTVILQKLLWQDQGREILIPENFNRAIHFKTGYTLFPKVSKGCLHAGAKVVAL